MNQVLEPQAQSTIQIQGVDYVEFYVGNAKQAAYFYQKAFGFQLVGYAGPETGQRDRSSYLLKQNKINFVLTTPLLVDHAINDHLKNHGDGVKDIALNVKSVDVAYQTAIARGATSIREPQVLSDEFGEIKSATVATYGDTVHTFIERGHYNGLFMPGFVAKSGPAVQDTGLLVIDHIVGNLDWDGINEWTGFYNRVFDFHQFASFDDKDISTEYSALRSVVMANDNEIIKFPLNEPATGKRKSQIEEFIQFNNGKPGVQHVALLTGDIIKTIEVLKANGVDFLDTPDSYYDDLLERVGEIDEDIEDLKRLKILVDRDDQGYMLQLFTKPLQDRPTLFFEIIQRKGGRSFGKGNFKALFESIEREQAKRGNL